MIGHEVLNENIVELIFVVDSVPGGVFAFAEMMNVPTVLFVLLIGAASVVNGFVESVALRKLRGKSVLVSGSNVVNDLLLAIVLME